MSNPDHEYNLFRTIESEQSTVAKDELLISESASLIDAIKRINECETAFTVFCVDAEFRVTGVLSRGDILRFIGRNEPEWPECAQHFAARDAMRPLVEGDESADSMLFIREKGPTSWYEQLTVARAKNQRRWNRIKLLPVLDDANRLVNVLDLESPRSRARIEALVMAAVFPLRDTPGIITDGNLAKRREEFDSIHYRSHWEKVRGLCELLLERTAGTSPMMNDIFNHARADELVHGLFRYEEWLKGHLSVEGLSKDQQDKLGKQILEAREGLVRQYLEAASTPMRYFPSYARQEVYGQPEVIIVLGCRGEQELSERIDAALFVARHMDRGYPAPTVVLSGGGDGHDKSEAQRMLDFIKQKEGSDSVSSQKDKPGWLTLTLAGKSIDVVLEEDSLDTLGNAVFSWLTLRREGDRFGLESGSSHRLSRIVLVTDAMHAPRSYDLFRRVFAFRTTHVDPDCPEIAVRTVGAKKLPDDKKKDISSAALDHLRSEALANLEIFRLVNPLTNGYDVIGNGHVRSILGQMIRLHKLYSNRWDLARKYQGCW